MRKEPETSQLRVPTDTHTHTYTQLFSWAFISVTIVCQYNILYSWETAVDLE